MVAAKAGEVHRDWRVFVNLTFASLVAFMAFPAQNSRQVYQQQQEKKRSEPKFHVQSRGNQINKLSFHVISNTRRRNYEIFVEGKFKYVKIYFVVVATVDVYKKELYSHK